MLNLSQITGFRAKAPIEIFDHKGRPFYVKNSGNTDDGIVYFNLPAGKYNTSNKLSALPKPLNYVHKKLPKPERNFPIPNLRVVVKPNPHKCTIYFKTGIIELDPEMAKLPRPNLMHILFHETGHFLYKTEWKCDVFSCAKMLKFGYNPSQCLKVLMHNLSSNKEETLNRAEKNYEFLKSVKWQV